MGLVVLRGGWMRVGWMIYEGEGWGREDGMQEGGVIWVMQEDIGKAGWGWRGRAVEGVGRRGGVKEEGGLCRDWGFGGYYGEDRKR
jgi:hypothetical protein